jgi:hypothetical protein
MMLVVMELERLAAHIGLERLIGIGQVRQGK